MSHLCFDTSTERAHLCGDQILVSNTTHQQKNKDFLEKWLIPGLGQGRCNTSLKYLVSAASEEVFKKQKTNGIMLKGHRSNRKSSHWPKLEQSEQENK